MATAAEDPRPRGAETAEVFLRGLTRWQAEQQRESVADLAVEAYRGERGEEFRDRQEFLGRFASDNQRPGFEMALAGSVAGAAGCAYGFPMGREGDHWRGALGRLPRHIEELTASGRVFVIADLMVLPAYRRRGVGTSLMELLLSRCDAALAVAFVDASNAPALGALRAWRWTRIEHLGADDVGSEHEVWSHSLVS
ncbi:GNAT family N-acetyltransferase [Streptodolium elevatio]|uniref:GNAT family N-acetyltransferase n=1 Tax=Streptodolium elevatio TaxID=3157996 RepID=A0ABV3DUR5_9ACTN